MPPYQVVVDEGQGHHGSQPPPHPVSRGTAALRKHAVWQLRQQPATLFDVASPAASPLPSHALPSRHQDGKLIKAATAGLAKATNLGGREAAQALWGLAALKRVPDAATTAALTKVGAGLACPCARGWSPLWMVHWEARYGGQRCPVHSRCSLACTSRCLSR